MYSWICITSILPVGRDNYYNYKHNILHKEILFTYVPPGINNEDPLKNDLLLIYIFQVLCVSTHMVKNEAEIFESTGWGCCHPLISRPPCDPLLSTPMVKNEAEIFEFAPKRKKGQTNTKNILGVEKKI